MAKTEQHDLRFIRRGQVRKELRVNLDPDDGATLQRHLAEVAWEDYREKGEDLARWEIEVLVPGTRRVDFTFKL